MVMEVVCPICSKKAETSLHALWRCSSLKGVRGACGLADGSSCLDSSPFLDFVISCSSQLGLKEFESICVLWWRIWHRRNLFIHKKVLMPGSDVVEWANTFTSDFYSANACVDGQRVLARGSSIRWQVPLIGYVKINTDAALNCKDKVSSFGVVIRDSAGRVLVALCRNLIDMFCFLVGLMMQQKIVIMLKLKCDKCRSKAMKIAAVADGVISVAWEGDEKNKVVMTGDGTDAATVTGLLRKKLGYADLQKIVIKVQVRCKKCWSKAMKIVAAAEGEIISVAWEGEGKDKMVVIGDGVDAATLTGNLRKKLGYAELLLVEEVKGKKEEKKEEKKEVKKEEKKEEKKVVPKEEPQCYQPFGYQLCGPVIVYHEDPFTSSCNIM
ncbi:hypothetical protein EZV62_008691 [Acer yangbiense]|uniref:HMA domain-containing protein n=1 Tax=Acer yangbiense TaxID=1000413 RepID=A0A5C7IG33_9ROSI|nr:hypothetical protein EZV62_008691 [Acer yangbiense]